MQRVKQEKIKPYVNKMTKSDLKKIFLLQSEFETHLQNLSDRRRASARECEERFLRDGFGRNPEALGFAAFIP